MAKLTTRDREIRAKARELTMLPGLASIREHTGETSDMAALMAFAGEAKYLLSEYEAIVSRLTEATDE